MKIYTTELLFTQIIDELEPFTQEDWDDEGAQPITSAALYGAAQILARMPDIEKPHMSPIVDGSIGLFWDTNRIYLDLQVLPTGGIAFKYRLPDGQEKKASFASATSPDLIEELRPALGFIVKPKTYASMGMDLRLSCERVSFAVSAEQPSSGLKVA